MATMYRLSAQMYSKVGTPGQAAFGHIRFTASLSKAAKHVVELEVPPNGIDGTLVALLAQSSPETAIRANQALKRGENVDLGIHEAGTLIEFVGFDDLEG